MPPKPISEQAFITSVERKQDDRASESAEVERPPVAESRATNDSRLAEAGPPAGVSGGVVNEVEAEIDVEEAMTTGAQVCRIDVNTPCSSSTHNFHLGFTRHGCRIRPI